MLFAQTVTYTVEEVSINWPVMGLYIALVVLGIVGMWKVFEKADEPGWASLIPLYNTYTLCRIAGRNGLWLLLFFIPLVNLIAAIIVMVDLAKHFGKSSAYAVGLIFLPFIFMVMLGFDDSKYLGPKHQ